MSFHTRKPVLPMLPMPPRNSSLDMPPFAFAASSSGTSTPSYGESLPHTPLPGTPLALGFEKLWPNTMITPTPTHGQAFTFDFNTCFARTDSGETVASAGSTGTLMPHEERARWSVDSAMGEDDDGLAWDDREEGILLSFLDNPLHPLSTPYPPGTLPPSSALDDITSQIIRFHSPPTPLGSTQCLKSPGLGLTSSVSAPSLPSAVRKGKSHRRTHSASGIPWVHSWRATRRKLYEIARREALGDAREDRFKVRVMDSPSIDKLDVEGDSTPMPRATNGVRLVDGDVDTPSGRILKRPGGMMMQRHGSETMLDFPEGELVLEERGVGQALRASSTLQRSTKAASAETRVRPTGMQRKPSLLQRGQSFTADDFNNCLSLSSDANDDLALHDQECVTPSAAFDTQTPTLQTAHQLDMTTPQPQDGQDLFGDMFGRHNNDLVSPPSSIFGSSDPCDISMDNEVIPATPDHVHVPCIMLTKTSPTPMIHARSGSGSSDFEIVSPPVNKVSGLGTPLNLSPPGSPKSLLAPFAKDLEKTPRPGTRPGLIRARSSTAAHKTPSAFSQFMNNTPSSIDPPQAAPILRSISLGLPLPSAKRQKLGAGLTIPLPSASLESGLASPFDEKKMFQ